MITKLQNIASDNHVKKNMCVCACVCVCNVHLIVLLDLSIFNIVKTLLPKY